MSTTPTDTPSGPGPTNDGPRVTRDEARDLGRLRRTRDTSPEGRYVAGVAGGLGRHFDIDPAILRVAFVVLVFFGGAGILLYGAAWLLVPEEDTGEAVISVDDRNRTVALYVAAALGVLALLGDSIGRFEFPWPIAIIALIVLYFVSRRDRRRAATGATAYGPTYGPTYGAAPAYGPSAGPVDGPAPGAPGAAPEGAATHDAWQPPTPEAPVAPGAPAAPVPPAAPPMYYVPPPARPRKRGPILFWFTLALIALLEGVLGIVDAAPGVDVPGPAYAALAVGVTGVMLVLGAFWGRAGGLIFVGLVATVALVISIAAQELDWESDRIVVAPATAADLQPRYDFDAGELRIDLTEISDLDALDGRALEIDGAVGRIEVVVPDELEVRAEGDVDGPGGVRIFDENTGGIDTGLAGSRPGDSSESPVLTIDTHLSVGQIDILDEDDAEPWFDRFEDRRNR